MTICQRSLRTSIFVLVLATLALIVTAPSAHAWTHGANVAGLNPCSALDVSGIDDGCDYAVANGYVGQYTYASVTGGSATAASFWNDIRQDHQSAYQNASEADFRTDLGRRTMDRRAVGTKRRKG